MDTFCHRFRRLLSPVWTGLYEAKRHLTMYTKFTIFVLIQCCVLSVTVRAFSNNCLLFPYFFCHFQSYELMVVYDLRHTQYFAQTA